MELTSLLAAFRRSHEPSVGNALAAALDNHPGGALVPYAEVLRGVRRISSRGRANRGCDACQTRGRVRGSAGDSGGVRKTRVARRFERGSALFFGAKASCSACHRIGTRGAAIGPDLSHIGKIRTRRDLGESILFPSLTLARGYEYCWALRPTTVRRTPVSWNAKRRMRSTCARRSGS